MPNSRLTLAYIPAFTVELYDTLSGNPLNHVSGIQVQLTMLDGFGNDATDKLTTAHHTPNTPLCFAVSGGSVSISGLRFASVSSKCGGTFRVIFTTAYTANDLETSVCSPKSSPGPSYQCSLTSPPIQILSYRLYHCRKLAMNKLTPNDNIAKMRGIGALYGKRLEGLGVVTVKDLAQLQVGDGMSVQDERRVMAALRRDRGAMTMTKLVEYVNRAREIVERNNTNTVNETPPKRRRTSGPQCVAPDSPPIVEC